ncbi:MAG: DUF202 domain-containing protein [Actinobacteria bacterium]|nr:DUF202 domain-containing protein [Actinomycetota bacterium]
MSGAQASPRDPGLQPERTSLAWQRTALALAVVGAATPRLLWPMIDAWALLPCALVVAGAAVLFVAAARRYRRMLGTVADTRPLDGRLPLLATLLVLVLGLVAAGLVVVPFLTT